MTGRRLGVLSLRLDALYCAVLGAGVIAGAPFFAPRIGLPAGVVVAVGAAVVVWAVAVAWMAVRLPLRPVLRVVTVANLVAAAGIAASSVTAAGALVLPRPRRRRGRRGGVRGQPGARAAPAPRRAR
jgi:hypothetical protein